MGYHHSIYAGDRPQAPGRAAVVQAFVNTADLERACDPFELPGGLACWLVAEGLLQAGDSALEADVRRAIALREALRDLLSAHNRLHADGLAARSVVDDVALRAELRFALTPDDRPELRATAEGVDGALGEIVAAVHAAAVDETWARLKACKRDRCRQAFYDASPNRSGRWCSMAICGSREKNRRAYWRNRS
jgi:predicted RNA-binding Zn ribbon-like protein